MSRGRYKKAGALMAVVAVALAGARLAAHNATPLPQEQLSNAAPRLVAPCTQRDFGTVEQGELVKATFAVENAGTRRLILIDKGETCCGQPRNPESFVVPPGGTMDLDVEVDTTQWCGRMEHVARYYTNDPAHPRLDIELTANVVTP